VEHPVVNLAFVITGWGDAGAALTLNEKPVSRGKEFRFGHRRTPEGKDLVVWINVKSANPVDITVTPQ
jgi:hypothetical protein